MIARVRGDYAVISYNVNHSIFWAIVHAFFGWFYVAYYVLTRAL